MTNENKPNASEGLEMLYSALTVISVCMGPVSFLGLQNGGASMWLSFSIFFGLILLGFFFQSRRRRETRRLRKLVGAKLFAYQIGDELQFQDADYVVIKHGFNHYYLKNLKSEQVILVKRAKVDLTATPRTRPSLNSKMVS